MRNNTLTKGIAAGALVVAGLGLGTAIMGGSAANAATNDTTTSAVVSTSTSAGTGAGQAAPDPTKPVRADEQLLTGDTATKVRDLALAQYPGATVQRVETDSEGVYEAHIVTADGDAVVVQVGADFTVTGTQSGGPGGSSGTGNPPAPPAEGSAPAAPSSVPSGSSA
jgi:hypothetical protein